MLRDLITTLIGGLIAASLTATACAQSPSEEKKVPEVMGKCPKTQIVGRPDDCLKCHVAPSFRLRESLPGAGYAYPSPRLSLIFDKEGKPVSAYYLLKTTDDEEIRVVFDYLRHHGIRHCVLELHSPGGGLFDGWRIVGLLRQWQLEGRIVETRVHGFAASAAFLIFASGSKGHRFIDPHAEVMWHELLLAMFGLKITTPSDSEEESRVLRHLQDTANEWLQECSKMSKEDIDKAIKKREFWMNGKQAIERGFADGFIGGAR